jgi:hypothetical protein
MKAIHIFLTILAISNFNLIAQHYIGQNELNWLKESKKSYDNVVGEKSTNFEVYLEGASKSNGYLSDVMVGFDKLKYQRGEIVTLTFKRSGSNSRVENERIAILGTTRVSADGFEMKKGQHYSIFYLKTNEVKKVFIQLRNKNQLLDRITMGIGRMGIASEGRGYIISYPPVANENENKKDTSSVKPEWRYFEPNNHHDFF